MMRGTKVDRTLARLAAEEKGKTALDMGTGSGYIAFYLAKKGFDVDAVDIDEKSIKKLQECCIKNNVNIDFFISNLFSNLRKKYDIIVFNCPSVIMKRNYINKITMFVKHTHLENLFFGIGIRITSRKRKELLRRFISGSIKRLKKNGIIILDVVKDDIGILKPFGRLKIFFSENIKQNGVQTKIIKLIRI